MAVNVRPGTETAYTVQSSDDGGMVVATNEGAMNTWTLPPGIAVVVLRNGSGHKPLLVNGPPFSMDGYSTAMIAPWQAITFAWDAASATYQTVVGVAGHASALGQLAFQASYSTVTYDTLVTFSGPVAVGDTIGYDYDIGAQVLSYHHAIAEGDTLGAVVSLLYNQMAYDPAFVAFVGDDLAHYGQGYPTIPPNPDGSYTIGWEQHWPNYGTVTACNTGASTTIAVANGSTNIVGGTAVYAGNSPKTMGREPQAGDSLFQLYVIGDTAAQAASFHNGGPIYSLLFWEILDPIKALAQCVLQAAQTLVSGLLQIAPPGVAMTAPSSAATVAMEQNADGVPTDHEIVSFGAFPRILFRPAGGTPVMPTAVKCGAYLGLSTSRSFDGAAYETTAAWSLEATEDHNAVAHGSRGVVYITPKGALGVVEGLSIDEGGLTVMGQKGFTGAVAVGQTMHFTGGILTSVT